MLFPRKSLLGLGVFAIASLAAQAAQAHAVAGDRVFVNTLLIDDPGVAMKPACRCTRSPARTAKARSLT